MASVTFLLFLRFRAIYLHRRSLIALFFAIWLGNVACIAMSLFVYSGFNSLEFGTSTYCVGIGYKPQYATIASLGPLVHDTCVFLAISYQLFQSGLSDITVKETPLGHYVLGRNLPHFSRALFINGQMLYLITVIGSTSAIILGSIPSVLQLAYRQILFLPQAALLSSVACRIFRNVRLRGVFNQSDSVSDLNKYTIHNSGSTSQPGGSTV
ncbi:hypothetical protein K435DRAFT_860757 [Dendrothele bispora CBS 962.96]|uniref:Uncharacterized protein n=1 Tax=Dendrothele bispora (strain CBS 962.96) TaxID=1314807 RepID=A0A4S8LX27_DENBC|nr:hypothetical protein K435DRAFT_860757 [Dendrothele bispora CBS 962.96]